MTGKTRILIVEDDMPLALLMVRVLAQAGCDVQFARNGKKGMEMAQEQKFDLIALDVQLPDTFEMCRDLKQRHISRRTPVIFISASSRQEDMAEAKKQGAVDCITKPFDVTDLMYKVGQVCRPATPFLTTFKH